MIQCSEVLLAHNFSAPISVASAGFAPELLGHHKWPKAKLINGQHFQNGTVMT